MHDYESATQKTDGIDPDQTTFAAEFHPDQAHLDDYVTRPAGCDCGDWNADGDIPCWECYAAGFQTPANNGGAGDD